MRENYYKPEEPQEPEHGQEESEHHHAVWEYGQATSALEASQNDMCETRKQMIRFALDQRPIRDIRTYAGYKGDLLLEITTTDYDLLTVLKEHAESLGMNTVIKEKHDLGIHEIYCITPDEDIYDIKLGDD
jgi:hypothetical protein